MRARGRGGLLCAGAAALLACGPLAAQTPDLRLEATAGSEAERYLRVLQVAGQAPLYPWSLRAFSPAEMDRLAPADSAHPWAARLRPGSPRGVRLRAIRPRLGLVFNAAAPDGGNDGAVWAGRGLTATASAGVALRAGPLSLRVEPQAFWTQNRAFEMMPTGESGRLAYADPEIPLGIDAPQRFGGEPYARVDAGQSTLRLDVLGLAAGVSTANQQWGPGEDFPLVLGTNAAGFLHGFAGTATPWNLGIGRVHGRLVWGSVEQSPYSSVEGHGSRRFVTGVVGTFVPFGLSGLEVGGSRFFHTAWPRGGLRRVHFIQPFQAFWKTGLDSMGTGPDRRGNPDNQVASAFARWVLPRGGVEFWGEYSRNDHSWDALDFVLEPDHSAGYALGGRKVWTRGARLLSLRAEWLDTQPSHLQVTRRWQGHMYTHARSRQGHTHRGQILGSPAAFGGGGGTLALDAYGPGGRWGVALSRVRVRSPIGRAPAPDAKVDVVHSLAGEAVLFRPGFDLVAGVRASYELNRHYRGDAMNLSASIGGRLGL